MSQALQIKWKHSLSSLHTSRSGVRPFFHLRWCFLPSMHLLQTTKANKCQLPVLFLLFGKAPPRSLDSGFICSLTMPVWGCCCHYLLFFVASQPQQRFGLRLETQTSAGRPDYSADMIRRAVLGEWKTNRTASILVYRFRSRFVSV